MSIISRANSLGSTFNYFGGGDEEVLRYAADWLDLVDEALLLIANITDEDYLHAGTYLQNRLRRIADDSDDTDLRDALASLCDEFNI